MKKILTIQTHVPGCRRETYLDCLASQWYSGYGFHKENEFTITSEYLKKLYAIARYHGIFRAIWHETKANLYSLTYRITMALTPSYDKSQLIKERRWKAILNGEFERMNF